MLFHAMRYLDQHYRTLYQTMTVMALVKKYMPYAYERHIRKNDGMPV